jgi:hypothetical protein
MILALSIILVTLAGGQVWAAAQKHYGRSCIDGSCAAGFDLDDITGMSDGNTALVPADPTYGGPLYYKYVAADASAESLPTIVDPDAGGDGRWLQQKLPIGGGGTGSSTASAARTALGLEIGSDVQGHDDNLDDLVALTPGIGRLPYWLTGSAMAVLDFNVSDQEGYIVQAGDAYPNSTPKLVNTINVAKIILPNENSPTLTDEGAIAHDNDGNYLVYYDGAATRTVVAADLAQTLENKDIELFETIQATATNPLAASEVRGRLFNNYGASGNVEHDLPTAASGYNFIAVCGQATHDISFDSATGDNIYLDGTAIGTGDMATIQCDAIGDTMTCFTFKTGSSQWDWVCTCGEGTCVDGGAGT